jgi:hypothetical protein
VFERRCLSYRFIGGEIIKEKKLVGVGIILIIAVVGITYQIVSSEYSTKLKEKDLEIEELQKMLEEIAAAPPAPPPNVTVEAPPPKVEEPKITEINCITCHELDKTKTFHVPQTIMKINAAQGTRRRVCIDCHGPLGPPWSADKQMTDPRNITYDSTVGLNGVFRFPNKVPHSIHKRKLEARSLNCEACHVRGEEFYIPQADVDKGQVLVCQNCMAHPEDGNYVTVHVEMKGYKCTICHTGDLTGIHREKTADLGQVPKNLSLADLMTLWR